MFILMANNVYKYVNVFVGGTRTCLVAAKQITLNDPAIYPLCLINSVFYASDYRANGLINPNLSTSVR